MNSFFEPRKKKKAKISSSSVTNTTTTTVQHPTKSNSSSTSFTSFFQPCSTKTTTTSSSSSMTNSNTHDAGTNKKKEEQQEAISFEPITPYPPSNEWQTSSCKSLLYYHPTQYTKSNKIAAFDIDNTILTTKSGKRFPTNDKDDWKFLNKSVIKTKLMQLIREDDDDDEQYRIVFFTNQGGIGNGKVNKDDWIAKMNNVMNSLNLQNQITILAAVSKTKDGDDFRKPHVGMWRFLGRHLSGGGGESTKEQDSLLPKSSLSFYVGDAAGRPKRGPTKKDFDSTDYKFALNIGGGLSFYTPEQFWYGSKNPSDGTSLVNVGFQPKVRFRNVWLSNSSGDDCDDVKNTALEEFIQSCRNNIENKKQEIVILCGSPACGKSSLTAEILALNDNDTQSSSSSSSSSSMQYKRINQDTLKTHAKCLQATQSAVSSCFSVIVDNTNRNVQTRSSYMKFGVPCRCVYVKMDKDVVFHLNALRGALGNKDGEDRRVVPAMAVHSFFKNMEVPTMEEGFEELVEIEFVPGPFDSKERKEAFFRFTH